MRRSPLLRGASRLVVRLRWFVVPAWLAGAVVAAAMLPGLGAGGGGSFGGVIPEDALAVRTQVEELEHFAFPLVARVAVVQRDPGGLDPVEQAAVVARAAEVTLRRPEPLLGALPILDSIEVLPSATPSEGARATTAVTYLFFHPDTSPIAATDAAREYAEGFAGADVIGVTGTLPARAEQAKAVDRALPLVEVATVALVALVMGLLFRSLVAPLVTLSAAGITYVLATRTVGWTSERYGIAVPTELEPIMVVLLIGVVTDYAIFFLSAYRRELRDGTAHDAARAASASITPVVLVAGFTVAAGTAALLAARLELFERLGPGLAITVAIAAVVSATFVPAAMAWFGRGTFWPRGLPRRVDREVLETPEDREQREGAAPGWRRRLGRFGVRRPVAAVVVAAGVGALLYAAQPVRGADVAANLIEDLPRGTEARVVEAAEAAEAGFAPGVVAPAEVVVVGDGVGRDRPAIERFAELLRAQPGIAGLVGPDDLPIDADLGLFVATSGDAARYVALLADDPYSAEAIDAVANLEARLPELLDEAGLGGTRAGIAGDTMLVQEIVSTAEGDLWRIALATALVDLLLLGVFLRSLVAPVVLLALSVLGVLVALAATWWVFAGFLGYDGLTFYVPFAVGVLLVAFGSDYNIFVVARIWDRAREHPLSEAIVDAGAHAGSAIAAAGTVLAASFAMLAIVPIGAFRQFALAMAAGVLIDTFFIRTLLLPAVVALLGRWSAWPSKALHPAAPVDGTAEPELVGARRDG